MKMIWIAVLAFVPFTGLAAAETTNLDGDAERCFAETERAVQGAEPASLSTASCRRALRYEPISRADRSAMLHNRGVIQQAQGDLDGAMASFTHAVRLSTTLDKRNLALAQVAQKLGEHEIAIEQYELLSGSGLKDSDPEAYGVVMKNLAVATAALAERSVVAAE